MAMGVELVLRCGNVDDAKMEGWKDGSLHRARGSLLFMRVCGCGGSLAAGRQTPEPEVRRRPRLLVDRVLILSNKLTPSFIKYKQRRKSMFIFEI